MIITSTDYVKFDDIPKGESYIFYPDIWSYKTSNIVFEKIKLASSGTFTNLKDVLNCLRNGIEKLTGSYYPRYFIKITESITIKNGDIAVIVGNSRKIKPMNDDEFVAGDGSMIVCMEDTMIQQSFDSYTIIFKKGLPRLAQVYSDTTQRVNLSKSIQNVTSVKKDYGNNCINEKSDLIKKIQLGKLIGTGTFGNVYQACSPKPCDDYSYMFAVKLAAIEKDDFDSPFSKDKTGWIEYFIMKDIITPLTYICPNLPILSDSYVCENCELELRDISGMTKKTTPCVIFLTELASGDLSQWLNTNPPVNELYNCLFQIMAGIHTIQKYAQLMNNDVKAQNILYSNIEPGGYFQYEIMGTKYYIPNIGKLFILNDFGVSKVYDPYFTMTHGSVWSHLGNRSAMIIDNKLSPIETTKSNAFRKNGKLEYPLDINWVKIVDGVWERTGKITKRCEPFINTNTGVIKGCDITLTQEQLDELNKFNITSDTSVGSFYAHPLIIPPLELITDTQDCIRMFTGGKRMTQRNDHTRFNISTEITDKLEKYLDSGKSQTNDFTTEPDMILAGYFITKFFTQDYPMFLQVPDGTKIGNYII